MRRPRAKAGFRPHFETLERRYCRSAFYDFEVIAKSDGALTSIQPATSINDAGQVAFVASTAEGQSVYVGDGTGGVRNITFGTPSSTRTYGQELQINNSGLVGVVDRTNGVSVGTLSRTWNADAAGSFTVFGRGTTPPTPVLPDHFDIINSFTSLSNDGSVAFSAINTSSGSSDIEIHLSKSRVAKGDLLSQLNIFQPPSFFRFMAADGDRAVIGSRNSTTGVKRVVWYDATGLDTSSVIAQSGDNWRDLGVRPGISDDGKVVTFYGDEASDVDNDGILGPGIFASVERAVGRSLIRIASLADGFASFAVDQRPSVGNMNVEQRASEIVFQATNDKGLVGIFASQLKYHFDPVTNMIITGFTASSPYNVIVQGESIPGLGTVNNLTLHDAVSNTGRLAFWADTSGGQAIVRTKLPAQRVVLAWGHEARTKVEMKFAPNGEPIYIPSPGSMPSFTVPSTEAAAFDAFKERVRARVQQQFKESKIDGVEVVNSQPERGATVVYFTYPLGNLLGTAYSGIDRFNRRSSDEVVVMVQTSNSSLDLETNAETITHEVGHSLGLRHINPPGAIEVMDYEDARNDIEVFSNVAYSITEPPESQGQIKSTKHNPVYHLKRYVEGFSDEELADSDINPGGVRPAEWDVPNIVFRPLESEMSFSVAGSTSLNTKLFNVTIANAPSDPHQLNVLAQFDEISLRSLSLLTFEITDGDGFVILASSQAGGQSDITLAVGNPFEENASTVYPQQGTSNYALQLVDLASRTFITLATVQFVTRTADHSWHNAGLPLDVSGDGSISAIDALLVINYLNITGGGAVPPLSVTNQPPPYLDANGDDNVSPIDALLIINELNAGVASEVIQLASSEPPWAAVDPALMEFIAETSNGEYGLDAKAIRSRRFKWLP